MANETPTPVTPVVAATTPVESTTTTTHTTTVEGKKSSALPKVIIILVIVMCLCLLCIGAAYFVFINFLNKTADSLNATNFNSLMNAAYNSGNSNSSTNATYNYTDPQTGGSFSMGSEIPSTFPSDIPIYSGATASFSSSDNNSEGNFQTTVTFTLKGSVNTVSAFYKTKMEAAGYTLTSESNIFGNMLTFENAKREVIVSVIGAEGEEDVVLSIISTDK